MRKKLSRRRVSSRSSNGDVSDTTSFASPSTHQSGLERISTKDDSSNSSSVDSSDERVAVRVVSPRGGSTSAIETATHQRRGSIFGKWADLSDNDPSYHNTHDDKDEDDDDDHHYHHHSHHHSHTHSTHKSDVKKRKGRTKDEDEEEDYSTHDDHHSTRRRKSRKGSSDKPIKSPHSPKSRDDSVLSGLCREVISTDSDEITDRQLSANNTSHSHIDSTGPDRNEVTAAVMKQLTKDGPDSDATSVQLSSQLDSSAEPITILQHHPRRQHHHTQNETNMNVATSASASASKSTSAAVVTSDETATVLESAGDLIMDRSMESSSQMALKIDDTDEIVESATIAGGQSLMSPPTALYVTGDSRIKTILSMEMSQSRKSVIGSGFTSTPRQQSMAEVLKPLSQRRTLYDPNHGCLAMTRPEGFVVDRRSLRRTNHPPCTPESIGLLVVAVLLAAIVVIIIAIIGESV